MTENPYFQPGMRVIPEYRVMNGPSHPTHYTVKSINQTRTAAILEDPDGDFCIVHKMNGSWVMSGTDEYGYDAVMSIYFKAAE